MNYYQCRVCGGVADDPRCTCCQSINVALVGSMYLIPFGLDAYLKLETQAPGAPYLLIIKPSGQERVYLDPIDFMKGM